MSKQDYQLEDDEAERDHDQGPPRPTHKQIARVAINVEAKPKLQLKLCFRQREREISAVKKGVDLLSRLR